MSVNTLQDFNIVGFQKKLIQWYLENRRELPWRQDQDPYKVWVSEIMLQQTKVDTVIPFFNRFIKLYPTVYDLAEADPQDVLKAWEGLGYYSRARNLQHAVREVVADYNGVVPDNPKELGSLKGIGPYTRGAILSIAFGQPEPAVDGNVMRVLSRVLMIEDNISENKVKRKFEDYVRELISIEDPSSFNQGMMELGALVCTPKSPSCSTCPVQAYCKAYDNKVVDQLPVKAKAKKQKRLPYFALLIRNEKNEYIIEQRPNHGLLADLWQFPMMSRDESNEEEIEKWVYDNYGVSVSIQEKKGALKHVFTHLIWDIEIYAADTIQEKPDGSQWKYVHKRDLRAYPFPVSHLNMMNYLQ